MDAELEKAITQAGRERVFDLVAANGWPRGSIVPKWVWREAIRQVEASRQ